MAQSPCYENQCYEKQDTIWVEEGRQMKYGLQDGNTDLDALRKAIQAAKDVTDKPSLLKVCAFASFQCTRWLKRSSPEHVQEHQEYHDRLNVHDSQNITL